MSMVCKGCGCTEDNACPGGCHWVSFDPPLCSECVEWLAGEPEIEPPADDRYCPASPTPAAHKPIWISETSGHCAACRQPFFASEAA